MDDLRKAIDCLYRDNASLTARVTLAEGMSVFEGHFPTQPILPGVVQLNLVKMLAEDWAGRRLRLVSVPQMKFTVPVRPGDTVAVTLSPVETPKGLSVGFSLELEKGAERLPASRGKVLLTDRR